MSQINFTNIYVLKNLAVPVMMPISLRAVLTALCDRCAVSSIAFVPFHVKSIKTKPNTFDFQRTKQLIFFQCKMHCTSGNILVLGAIHSFDSNYMAA